MWPLKCTPFYYMLAEPAALLLHLRSIVCQTYFCSPVRGRKDRNERVAHETSPLWQALHKKKKKKKSGQCGNTLGYTHFHTVYLTSAYTCQQFSLHFSSSPSVPLRKQRGMDQWKTSMTGAGRMVAEEEEEEKKKQTNSKRGRRAMTLDKMSTRCCGSSSSSTSDGSMC